MNDILSPQEIDATTYKTLTDAWAAMMENDSTREENLKALLRDSKGRLLNYAYLPNQLVAKLLDPALNTLYIITKFAIANCDTGDNQIFTLVLVCLDGDYTPQAYFRAGISLHAKVYIQGAKAQSLRPVVGDQVIPLELAESWVAAWNLQGDQSELAPFFLSNEPAMVEPVLRKPLLGYQFEVGDFTKAWQPHNQKESALWLCFDLHGRLGDGEDRPFNMFSTTVTINTTPSDTIPDRITLSKAQTFYDISRPCPPACLI